HTSLVFTVDHKKLPRNNLRRISLPIQTIQRSTGMRYAIPVLCLLVLVVICWPAASAQQLQLGKEPGLEVPEVTAGPDWKTCPRCQNNAHIRAAKEKYKVDGHAFDPHDLSGVWGNNGINLDFKT